MLVRDQDRRQAFGGDADGAQALESFFARETRVDQQARAFGGNEGTVTGAGRRKYRELENEGASYLLEAETMGRRKRFVEVGCFSPSPRKEKPASFGLVLAKQKSWLSQPP